MSTNIFKENASQFWAKGLSVCPIIPGQKASIRGWNNYIDQPPNPKTRSEWLEQYAGHGIGLLAGQKVSGDLRIVGIDIDDDRYVETVRRMIGNFVSGKKGKKGLTIFALAEPGVKKTAIPAKGARIVDILVRSVCVLPPTRHPDTGNPYEWYGQSLLDCDLSTLPVVSDEMIEIIGAIFENENHKQLMGGKDTHDAALSLMASLAGQFDDENLVCKFVRALLPEDYSGNTANELPEMFRSAQEKGLGRRFDDVEYNPEDVGPQPLGYTDGNHYVFLHQKKNILAVLPPAILMSEPGLCDLAPLSFWLNICPKLNKDGDVIGIDAKRIGDMLMQKCRDAGPFHPTRVRGCGIWREKGRIVQNLSGEIPRSQDHTYIRFASLPPFRTDMEVDAQRLLEWFSLFPWTRPGLPLLLLGWVALAPVCGALEWRPHIFINGPKNSGKTTLIRGLCAALDPMVISVDGTSTEAGIRQSIGADSRPVILDEFEADRNIGRMKGVLKLARSASSADGAIVRGTPEGRAMQFQLQSAFCFGAINPIPGTNADASRIVELELQKHESNPEIKKEISEGLEYLRERQTAWCHQMIGLIEPIIKSIETLERAMPPGESRHIRNMSSLLAAAFVALHGEEISSPEAGDWVAQHHGLLAHLAQVHEEDDAEDCLRHLLCFIHEGQTVGERIKLARTEGNIPALLNLGIKILPDGILVAHKHPEVVRIFQGTLWAEGTHKSALKRLPGARADDASRARFAGGPVTRCTFIPMSCLYFKETPEEKNEIRM